MNKKTVIIGASANPERYSYLAIKMLKKNQHDIVAIGNREGEVDGISIVIDAPNTADVDTITLYLNPAHQRDYYPYILSLKPRRIIFNPGTENRELFRLAKENSIQPIYACTLVMLSTGQY